jgi:hypothetical protein
MQWSNQSPGIRRIDMEPTISQSNSPEAWNWSSMYQSQFRKSYRSRYIAAAALILIALSSLLALFYLTSWYQPLLTQNWIIVTESYSRNLLVPQTVPAVRSGLLLADLVKNSDSENQKQERLGILSESIVEVKNLSWLSTSLKSSYTNFDSNSIFLFNIFCHGLSDEKGPYLLKDWMQNNITTDFKTPEEKDKIRITELLQDIVDIAQGRPAVVVLDAEMTLMFQALGNWQNHFSEDMMELESWIEKQPNLVVILSTQENEKSSVDLKRSESLFGRVWRDHLGSNSPLGQSFSLATLFEAVKTKTSEESWSNFGFPQNPIMMPFGDEGIQRATPTSRIRSVLTTNAFTSFAEIIGLSGLNKNSLNANQVSQNTINQLLREAWVKYDNLSKMMPPPYLTSPQKWMIYKAALVRYEELLIAGANSAAESVRQGILKLEQDFNESIVVPNNLINSSLAISERYYNQYSVLEPDWLRSEFEKIWLSKSDDIEKKILSLTNRLANEQLEKKDDVLTGSKSLSTPELQNLGSSETDKPETKSEPNKRPGIPAEPEKEQIQPLDSKSGSKDISTQKTDKQEPAKDSGKTKSDAQITEQQDLKTSGKENLNSVSIKTDPDSSSKIKQQELQPYRRQWIYNLIVEKLRTEDRDAIEQATKWLRVLRPANEHLPIEFHIISLASRDSRFISPESKETSQSFSIRTFIELCLTFEKVMTSPMSHNANHSILMNHGYFWFRPQIEEADKLFQEAWDILFSHDTNKFEKSGLSQRKALAIYKQILVNSEKLTESINIYSKSLERLSEISTWMLREKLNSIYHSNQKTLILNQISQISSAWNDINAISVILQSETDYDKPAQERESLIIELYARAKSLETSLESIEKEFFDFTAQLTNEIANIAFDSFQLLMIRNVFYVTSIDTDTRIRLLELYFRLRSETKPQNIITRQKRPTQSPEYLRVDKLIQTSEIYRYNMEFDTGIRTSFMRSDINADSTKSRINNFEQGLMTNQINILLNEIQSMNRLSPEKENFKESWKLDRILRAVPLSMVGDGQDDFTRIRLIKMVSEQLDYAAKRLWKFHWGPLREGNTPYYMTTGRNYINFASRLIRENDIRTNPFVETLKLFDYPAMPELKLADSYNFASLKEIELPFEISYHPNEDYPPGKATLLLQPDPDLSFSNTPSLSLTFDKSINQHLIRLEDSKWEEFQRTNDPALAIKETVIESGLLFRGNYLASSIPLTIYRQPGWKDIRIAPTQGGSISLRSDPGFIEKYGKSGGSVSFVLDCSGSMGTPQGSAWSDSAKYAQSVNAVIETIKQLPRDTQISIWVFGEAVGETRTAPSTDTIRQVVSSVKWNPNDVNIIDNIRSKISYPACIPWNKSPIIETMRLAGEELRKSDGPKMMIVITDGQDTGIDDPTDLSLRKLNSNKNNSPIDQSMISSRIRSVFSGWGISVNVIGFKLSQDDSQAFQDQFSVVKDLPVSGVYTTIDDDTKLISAINGILRRKLIYRIDSFSNESVRSETIDGLELQPEGVSDQWITPSLKSDIYKVWIDLGNRVEHKFSMKDGRRIILRLKEDEKGSPGFFRDSWLESDFAWRPSDLHNDFRLTWIASKLKNQGLNILLAADQNLSDKKVSMIESFEPDDWNFSVLSNDTTKRRLSGSVRRTWNYPSATWELNLSNYDRVETSPSVHADFYSGRSFDPIITLTKGVQFQNLSEVQNLKLQVNGRVVYIKFLGVEDRWVPDSSSSVNVKKKCWVLRIQHDPELYLRGDLILNNSKMNTLYQYFWRSGTTETLIWNSDDNSNDIEKLLVNAINIINLEDNGNQNKSRIKLSIGENADISLIGNNWPEPVKIRDSLRDSRIVTPDLNENSDLPPALSPENESGQRKKTVTPPVPVLELENN